MTFKPPTNRFSALDPLKTLVETLETESQRLRALEHTHRLRIKTLLDAHHTAASDGDADIIWEERKAWISKLKVLTDDHDQLSIKLAIYNRKLNK